MATALEEPGSHALLIAHRPQWEASQALGSLLVERCGLSSQQVHALNVHEPELDLLVAEVDRVVRQTTGTLLVVISGQRRDDDRELPAVIDVLARSRAQLLLTVIDQPPQPDRLAQLGERGGGIVLTARPSTSSATRTLTELLFLGVRNAGPELTVATLVTAADGDLAVIASRANPDGVVLARNAAHRPPELPATRMPVGGPVAGLAAFTDDTGAARLAVATSEGLAAWDPVTRQRVWQQPDVVELLRTATSHDGRPLLVGRLSRSLLRIWDARTGNELLLMLGDDADVTALGTWPSGDGARFVAAYGDSSLRVSRFTPSEGTGIAAPTERAVPLRGRITAVATVPESPAVVATGTRGQLVLADSGDDLVELTSESRDPGTALAVLPRPDGARWVAAGYGSGRIAVWDLDQRNLVRTLTGHTTRVDHLLSVPLPDGRPLLASSSSGGSVRLWDPATGEQLQRFPTSGGSPLATFLGPDSGVRLAAGGGSGDVRIWDLPYGRALVTGPVVTRGFADRVAAVDLLDRGAYVAGLVEALDSPGALDDPEAAGDEDGELGPTVITVEGPWGSGKSTILDLVRRQLDQRVRPHGPEKRRRLTVARADRLLRSWAKPHVSPKQPESNGVLVATFNPWRHQSSEQVWAGLARTLTDVADQHLRPDRDSRERYWFTRNAARVDRRRTQRELWRRTLSPLLTVGLLGVVLSLFGQLAKLDIPARALPWLLGALLAPGVVHTAVRYLCCRASAFLPGELFAGPVLSTALAGTTAADPAVRDPYYHARSGYLYLVQHDVTEVLADLAEQGYRLVVLVDDLDRCTPKTTAEVFEAINVFLSDELPRTRFVLGLDPVVVAAHVDQAYRDLADARVVAHPDDPSPGWTFLRKLVQLPVLLPRTREDGLDRLLTAHLGPVHVDGGADAAPAAEPAPEPEPRPTSEPEPAQEAESVTPEPVVAPAVRADRVVVDLERHPQVRERFRRTLAGQPNRSVREEKRLINAWQFYVRVLARSAGPAPEVRLACLLVTVAEIVTRWPAYQHALRRVLGDGRTGLRLLAEAVGDDVAWGAALAALGLPPAGQRAMTTLRAALRDCDAPAVADLAATLL